MLGGAEAYLIPLLIGVAVGLLSGLLGVGGGTIMIPVFRLVMGLSPVMASATSLFVIIPTSVSGAITHLRQKTCIPAVGIAAGIGGALTSPFGAYLASISPGWLIMLLAALIIAFTSVKMIRSGLKRRPSHAKGPSAQLSADDADVQPSEPTSAALVQAAGNAGGGGPFAADKRTIGVAIATGLGVGVLSGYVGLGGGFLMVPLFAALLHLPMRTASGTSLLAIMILAIPGAVTQGVLGNIAFVAGIAMAIGAVPAAILGANLAKRISDWALRLCFGCFLLLAAALLVVNEFGLL